MPGMCESSVLSKTNLFKKSAVLFQLFYNPDVKTRFYKVLNLVPV